MARTDRRRERPLALEQLEDRCLLTYTVTDLGTLGGNVTYPEAVNNRGQVAGYSDASAGQYVYHAFLYNDGRMADLGTLGGPESYAWALNDADQVAGWSERSLTGTAAFRWDRADGMKDLGTLGGADAGAVGINQAGWVLGSSATASGATHLFLYDGTALHDIDHVNGGAPKGINNAGAVVGQFPGINNHAFLEDRQGVTDLGTLGGSTSRPTAINDANTVVGASYTAPGVEHAFRWQAGGMTDLGTLPGMTGSAAYGINNAGDVVGLSDNPNQSSRAFLYHRGVLTDLNDAIDPNSGWVLVGASGISDTGYITGNGFYHGQYRAYLLTPDDLAAGPRGLGVGSFLVVAPFAAPSLLTPVPWETAISDPGQPLNSVQSAAAETGVEPPALSPAPWPLTAAASATDAVFLPFANKPRDYLARWDLDGIAGEAP